jgi:enoyl-CoA hydratase/carnithine racemase
MEPLVRQDLEGGVVRLSISTGAANPLAPDLFVSFDNHLGDLEVDPPRALVLDGGDGKLFSGGFDLKTILQFNRREMLYFFRHFTQTVARLVELPAPTLCAIHGHAIAGGFILPLACDFRVVQTGPLRLGLGEVDLGAAVPAGAQVLLGARTNPAAGMRLALFAGMLSPNEAADLGYADVLAEDAQAQAMELAFALASKPGEGVRATKLMTARLLAEQVRIADSRGTELYLDTWFSEIAQTKLHALAQAL